ncbi:MAG: hypothetical protein PHD95_02230, partial [Candidatus ainarchaeum sp.]|nr:hypothetical protein [Candidatus ainarchaeum sp.]
AACGGGKALCVENLAATAKNVSGFAQSIGWSDKAGETIGRAIRKMPLSADPEEHARQLHRHYERLGIKHRAIVQDLEKGSSKTIVRHGKAIRWIFSGAKAACADARHQAKGSAREQVEQSPRGFYFGEKPVPKNSYNEIFTIAGASPEYIKGLLAKAEKGEQLSEWEEHNLTAVMLSTFYYCYHKWPNYEKLSAMLQK